MNAVAFSVRRPVDGVIEEVLVRSEGGTGEVIPEEVGPREWGPGAAVFMALALGCGGGRRSGEEDAGAGSFPETGIPVFTNDRPAMDCNAGLARHPGVPRSPLLLTLPAAEGRQDLTCFADRDEGRTWPLRRRITNEGGYSDVAVSSGGTILVAYERDEPREGIALARFNLAWLEGTE